MLLTGKYCQTLTEHRIISYVENKPFENIGLFEWTRPSYS